MTHDPMCPCQSHKQPHVHHLSGVCHYCHCDLIALVRADERRIAVLRIKEIWQKELKERGYGPPSWVVTDFVGYPEQEAAIRGEQS